MSACYIVIVSIECVIHICLSSVWCFRAVLLLPVGPIVRYIIGRLIVPSNSNRAPWGLSACALSACLFSFRFRYFLFLSASFLLPFLVSLFGCTYCVYVGVISLQVVRDGITQFVSNVPLSTGAAVRVWFLYSSIVTPFFVACFVLCDHGLDSRRMRLCVFHVKPLYSSRRHPTHPVIVLIHPREIQTPVT